MSEHIGNALPIIYPPEERILVCQLAIRKTDFLFPFFHAYFEQTWLPSVFGICPHMMQVPVECRQHKALTRRDQNISAIFYSQRGYLCLMFSSAAR
jgi:hypothetical protein